MRIKRFLLSRWFIYLLITSALLIFILIVLPFWIQNQTIGSDLGDNLFAESWGLLFTVLILTMLFELRENIQWQAVKKKVYDRIGAEVYSIFKLVVHFIDVSNLEELETLMASPKENLMKDFFFTELEALNNKDEIQLDEKGRKILSEGRYAYTFEVRRKHFDEIETKYSKYLEPLLVTSLMEIQNNLQGINSDINELMNARARGYVEIQEFIFGKIPKKMHRIIKEIYKIHKMGKEIYPKQT